jgi:hypothetical protein
MGIVEWFNRVWPKPITKIIVFIVICILAITIIGLVVVVIIMYLISQQEKEMHKQDIITTKSIILEPAESMNIPPEPSKLKTELDYDTIYKWTQKMNEGLTSLGKRLSDISESLENMNKYIYGLIKRIAALWYEKYQNQEPSDKIEIINDIYKVYDEIVIYLGKLDLNIKSIKNNMSNFGDVEQIYERVKAMEPSGIGSEFILTYSLFDNMINKIIKLQSPVSNISEVSSLLKQHISIAYQNTRSDILSKMVSESIMNKIINYIGSRNRTIEVNP